MDTGATRTTPAFRGAGLALSRRWRPRLPEVSRQECKSSSPAAPAPALHPPRWLRGRPQARLMPRGCLRDLLGSAEEPWWVERPSGRRGPAGHRQHGLALDHE
ncbi:uncharacterized protein LOC143673274 [Tamandua tetradactyla]|uniref:uncharacterized protein LOC143673274 n=1 Tax=Tamandua tetradactyla TaxID=48850 RepID=UPI00405478B4